MKRQAEHRAWLRFLGAFALGTIAGVLGSVLGGGRTEGRASQPDLQASAPRSDPYNDPRQAAGHATAAGDLGPVLGELSVVLRELGNVLREARLPAAPSERAPLEGTAIESERGTGDLAAAVRALTRALETLPDTGARPAAERPLPHAPKESLFARLPIPHDVLLSDDAQTRQDERMAREHMLWSIERLLETYGRPDNIWPRDRGIAQWYYLVPLEDGWAEGHSFWVRDGMVYSAESELIEPEG